MALFSLSPSPPQSGIFRDISFYLNNSLPGSATSFLNGPKSIFCSTAAVSNRVDLMQPYNSNSILQLMYYEHAINSPPWLSPESELVDPPTAIPVNPMEPDFSPVESTPVEPTHEIQNNLSDIGKEQQHRIDLASSACGN